MAEAPASPPHRGTPTCAAVRLHVERRGRGSTVVMLHGFGGSARNFRPQARALEATHQVVVYDARGHARSEAPPEPEAYEPECFVGDLARVVDETGAEPVVLVGLSMGAGIALRYTLQQPARVRALALMAFPSAPPASASAVWPLQLAEAIEARGLEAAGEELVWGQGRFDAVAAHFIKQGFLEHPPHALMHTARRLLARQPSPGELQEALRGLRLPVLLLVGALDAPSLAASQELARLLPDARLVVLPNTGHVVNLQRPTEVDEELTALLARSGA